MSERLSGHHLSDKFRQSMSKATKTTPTGGAHIPNSSETIIAHNVPRLTGIDGWPAGAVAHRTLIFGQKSSHHSIGGE